MKTLMTNSLSTACFFAGGHALRRWCEFCCSLFLLFLFPALPLSARQVQQEEGASATEEPIVAGDDSLSELQRRLFEAGPLAAPPELLRAWADARAAAPIPTGEDVDHSEIRSEAESSEVEDAKSQADYEYLLSTSYATFREDGSLEVVHWEVMRPMTRDAATAISQLTADWSPWRMEKPKLSARVFALDGDTFENDGSSSFEQSASDGGTNLTDARRLTLLLDGVEPNSLVETKTISVSQPLFDQSNGYRFAFTNIRPARCYRLFVRSLGEQPLRYTAIGETIKQLDPSSDSLWDRVLSVEDPVSIIENYEPNCGPDNISYPHVFVSRPSSWKSIGRSYSEMVDTAIAEGSGIIASQTEASAEQLQTLNEMEKVEWALDRVRRLLRYTGVAFGEQRVFPVSPDLAVQRRFGDCKDQATLLVALLRKLGLKAHVALLYAGASIDVPENCEVGDYFNHAVVYVDSLDLWIDPASEEFPAGMLPSNDCQRRALICASEESRLVTTPPGDSRHSTFAETQTYRVNFSGGGDLSIHQFSTGEQGITLAAAYQEQPQQMKRSWELFFENYTGEKNRLELQYATPKDSWCEVVVRGPATQFFTRENFRIGVPWDVRELLEQMPDGIRPYIDSELGAWVVPANRRHPLIITTGITMQRTLEFYYPAPLQLIDQPQSWEKQLGPVRLSFTVSELLASEAENKISPERQWKKLAASLPQPDEAWLAAHDRLLRFKFEAIVEPGTMTAEEVNTLISEISQLLQSPGGCCGNLTLNWQTGERLQQQTTDEGLAELIGQAHQYRSLLDPASFLLAILNRTGFEGHMDKLAPKFDRYLPEFSITNGIYLNLLVKADSNGYSPWSDFKRCADFYRGQATSLSDVAMWVWLISLAVDETGLASEDAEVRREVIKQGKELLQLQSYNPSAMTALVADRVIWTALAANDDREYRAALPLSRITRQILSELSPSRSDDEIESLGLTKDVERKFLATTWEMLLASRQYDLANRFLERFGTRTEIEIESISEATATLSPLDEYDPQSLARHVALAYLNYDREQLKQLSYDEVHPVRQMQGFNVVGFASSWFATAHMLRNRSLHEAIIATAPTTVQEISPLCTLVEIQGPHRWLARRSDGTTSDPSFKVVRLDESAPWRVELNSPTYRWLTMMDAGRGNLVTPELELLLNKSSGFMDIFVQRQLPLYEQLWRRIDQDAPYRTELVVRTWAAMYQGNAKLLDDWLANQQLDLTRAQLGLLEEARRIAWLKQKDHASMIRSLVAELTPTSPLTELARLIPSLENEKRDGGTLWQQESTAKLLDAMLADDQLEPRHRAAILFLRDEDSAAWALLRDQLDNPGDLNPTKIDYLSNSYLWRVLMKTTDKAEIAEAFTLAKAKLSTRALEDKNLAHTFACAAAEVGELLMAFDYLTKHGTSEPHDELLRGLILKRCGFDDVANELLRKVVNEKPGNGSAVIAELRL